MAAAADNQESTDHHTDSNPTTTTDEPVLTPMETNSTAAEVGSGGSRPTSPNGSRNDQASKTAGKSSQKGNDTTVSDKAGSDGSAAPSNPAEVTDDEADLSSDSDTNAKGQKKTVSKKGGKSGKEKAQVKAKAPKKRRAKKPKKAPTPVIETESDSSESDSSDEDSEDDSKAKEGSVEKQLGAILEHITRLEQRVSQPQGYPFPPLGVGYPPAPGMNYGGFGCYPYGAPLANLNQPTPTPSGSSRTKSSQPSTKGLDTSRNSGRSGFLERLLAPSFDPLGDFAYGYPGARDRVSEEDDTDIKSTKKSKKRVEFKRVDSIWDSKLHQFKLQDTVENVEKSGYDKYIFHVRRTFDFDNKYRSTLVDIRSKLLRECLQDVIGNVKGISLVDETPKIYPNQLFLYLEDLREHLKALKVTQPAGDTEEEIKKNRTRLENKQKHLKLLIKYLDTDYAKVKDSLTPMLANGIITYDLLWALWKPHTLAYSPTYGSSSEPRVFKVNMASQHDSILSGKYYHIDGKYFEYDGKKFGYGTLSEEISEFVGARKITSLRCYPLKYHKDEAQLRADLIERGKKFVSLGEEPRYYKAYEGIAFQKRKKNIPVKFHIQPSRIMVDPATFRRINPNYLISSVKAKDKDVMSDSSDDSDHCCGCDSDDSDQGGRIKYVRKFYRNETGNVCMAKVPESMVEREEPEKKLGAIPGKDDAEAGDKADEAAKDTKGTKGKNRAKKLVHEFTDEDYLIASPVVLGFSFSEKLWLELAVSGVKDIKWNDKAWDSLVLGDDTKDLVKALVESRTWYAASTIDDVIQGKGKGLVTVLHGPPGTGKTLTAEGISELLKCPLYMVSAGELGTDSRFLEAELQKILDICHTWGAILLLDEADVFLEKRDMHNIHRNALVSVFLRQLEYFQGILFLTTNRVETFDEAFQSRIHIALRYENLDQKAKRKIFEMFLGRVKALGKIEVKPLTDDDLHMLSMQDLNGREIKNVVGSAQDLAVNKGEALSIRHIKQVLQVHAKFGRDLKGGSGYEDAMRSYF